MAIINITPDSFSDGGKLGGLDAVIGAAAEAVAAGAGILDVGGESTRPGALEVSAGEELSRVIPVVKALSERFPEAVISIDTRKATVAEAAVAAGASIINDVSGLQFDPEMAAVAARLKARLVIMHSQGTPETMQENPHYPGGVVAEVHAFFEKQIRLAEQAGVSRENIILDPGFGFGKTRAHNLGLLRHFDRFHTFNLPLLAGLSRKSFLTLGSPDLTPDRRENLTAAALALAIERGASIVRVHDTRAQLPAVRLAEAMLQA